MKPEVLDAVSPGQLDEAYGKRPRPLKASREYYRCSLSSVNGNSAVFAPPDIRLELVLELDGPKVCIRLRGKTGDKLVSSADRVLLQPLGASH